MREFRGVSDEELIRRYLAGGRRDDAIFAELFRRRRDDVWGTCRAFFGSDKDAEDLTQEVFFTAYRKLHQFEGRASLRTWIHRITTNICKNELRRRSRRTEGTETELNDSAAMIAATDDPEDRVVHRRRRERLRRALQTLAPDQRRILQQVEFEERPYVEIARELGVSVGAVKMRVLRARLTLKSIVESLDAEGVKP